MNKYFKTSYGKYLAIDQKPMGEFKIFCWHDVIIMCHALKSKDLLIRKTKENHNLKSETINHT